MYDGEKCVRDPGKMLSSKCPLSEVVPAEGGWLATRGHKLVKNVDALHVVHDTESEILGDVASAIHPSRDCGHEVLNLSGVALRTSSEVLASILGDPDVPAKGGVEILAVADECLRIGAIPVNGDGIDAAAIAGIKEILQPDFTARAGGDSGRYEVVALALEGLKVLPPKGSGVAGRKIGLAVNIGFVEA
jgi:hypothetical protein